MRGGAGPVPVNHTLAPPLAEEGVGHVSVNHASGRGLKPSITVGAERRAVHHMRAGLGAVNHPLPNQVAALGRSLAAERGRSLIEGGALRALEIAVGGAQARVGGACRALDRAKERLRLQQVGGAWGEGAEPLTGRGGSSDRKGRGYIWGWSL